MSYTKIIQCKNENELIYLSNAIYESGLVIYSAPDYYGGIALHSIPPSDPKYSYQYYLNNTGQAIPTLISNSEYGSAGMDIKAVNAWMFVQYLHNNLGNAIKVAVIDDGVEDPEDLMTGSSNRVLQGWTCGGGNGHPMDNSLHGQCVAGIIAASHNDKGVAGIAPNTEIIPICIQKDHSFLHLSFNGPYYSCFYSFGKIARAIRKAWNKFGAEILNNSWGSTVFIHDKILRAFEKAANKGRDGKGCVITASAGNESSTTNTNEIGRMPYSINVGAIDKNGFRTSYSNYSSGNQPGVDIVAFGGRFDSINPTTTGYDIRTIDREGNRGFTNNNYHDFFGGTSAAAPMVSGVASLMLSVNPNLTGQQVKDIIEQTAQKLPNYTFAPVSSTHPNGTWNNEVGYGLVDAHKSVVYAYMYGHDVSLSVEELLTCSSYSCVCNIWHPELFTYEWSCSSNMCISVQNDNQVTLIPLSSGTGTVSVNILSYGRIMYTQTATVDLSAALPSSLQPVATTPIN
ncbi:MAG: S8 family serine peptidase, partial [Bacteroidales bacterium]|nr:S8 family serine peptidase [Bacteroidales bacterium]